MADTSTQTNELTVTVEQPSSFSRHLSITVPKERVERIRRAVAQQVTRNVRMPGFRKGHVPQSLMDKQYGPAIQQETVDRVIQETYPQVLEQESIRPIAQGTVKDVHYHEGGELHYHVEVEVQPVYELARTSGFVVPTQNAEIGDTEVDALLERLRGERAELVVVEDRKPTAGDEVQVRITPQATEGEDAPEAEEFKFVLGEGQAIPDIEEAIQTLSAGEEGEFDVTFPEDFGDPAQAGTTQHLTIGLVELRERKYPELDDDFARAVSNGEFENIAALRERVHADLTADAGQRADQASRDALLGEIAEANAIEVPESMVQNYLEYMMQGMSGGGEQGRAQPKRTPEQEERFSQFREMLRPQAEATIKRMLVVETLADREGLRATQDDVDARVEQLAEQHGQSPSDVWLQLEKSGQLQQVEADITESKVLEWLRSHNTAG